MSTARLPGIYFETVPMAPPALLPRMDIAAFAGFTPSGPIGLPFAVEDPDRFQDIFGTDLPLVWDPTLNQMRLAQTPPAVRSFFRNGGQRCWVVRLANGAVANTWTIPGLLQVDGKGYHAGWVQARSEGSWSDNLTVNATLLESPLPAQAPPWPSDSTLPSQLAELQLNDGDLAQLFFPETQTLAYFDDASSQWFWFEPALPLVTSPPPGQPDQVFFLGAGADIPLSFFGFAIENAELALEVSRATALSIPPGSWLRMTFGNQTLLSQVEAIGSGTGPFGSLPTEETATLTSAIAWWTRDPASAWAAHQGQPMQASIVTFQLWAWPQGEAAREIAGLAFSPQNPQYWGLLPTDSVLYAPVLQPGPLPYAALADEIDNPRFPLAGPPCAGLGLPLGMTALVQADFTQAPTQQPQTALERDGLKSFDQTLFLDSRLDGSNSATLLPNASYWQYQVQNSAPLQGIHSLLGTEEISMLAVPDAIHSGWQLSPPPVQLLAAPDLQVSAPDESGSYTVSWSMTAGAVGYTLNESTDPQFGSAVTPTDAGPDLSVTLTRKAQCPAVFYYRVSAYGPAGDSPWSQTVSVELGTGDFVPCNPVQPTAPGLTLIQETNRVILSWSDTGTPAGQWTLQVADDPLFASASPLYQGQETDFTYWTTPGPPLYFRVSVTTAGGQASPWSDIVQTAPEPPSPWQPIPFPPSGPPPVLIAVHQAMLTMAAARGDMVAILSLPYVYRKSDATTYESQLMLAAEADPLPTMPSYGALYHPWTVTLDNTSAPPQSLRNLVPDGAVSGLIASTTLASGAWIAPANLAVADAVSLAPVLEPDAPLAFAASQINLIAQQPAGFLVTSQDTMMPDGDDLQPLNVRRLLILLRRLALREGVRRVFDNISPSFQRAVTRLFEQWMQLLMARGAFAGASAADSYQVIADASVNTQTSIDQGRFIVELKVAPSVPMRYLTVKLVQSGGQMMLVEG